MSELWVNVEEMRRVEISGTEGREFDVTEESRIELRGPSSRSRALTEDPCGLASLLFSKPLIPCL